MDVLQQCAPVALTSQVLLRVNEDVIQNVSNVLDNETAGSAAEAYYDGAQVIPLSSPVSPTEET